MAGSGTTTSSARADTPIANQIDSGVLIAVTGGPLVTYVTIYRPPVNNPPSGFSNSYVYYYIQQALPTAANTTLSAVVTTPSGSPGFAATSAVKAPHSSFTNQGRTPSASTTLWVHSSGDWGFEWNVTGTGSSATGDVVWWNNSSSNLSPSTGNISNSTSLDAGVTYSATDSVS